ncbi:LytR C-terminal domain-containing protein [uncultured Massilia sp.]|uniref:LytR C-terminal domain-containing protein n=1 Tax=uncultured Massilia sp. TaxID=169973 RepID=UPI0025F9896D|nr:LytR C-terminal domain-containing protein [uncultured Massilia sp.]
MRPLTTRSRILPTTLSLLCGALLLACAAPPAQVDAPAADGAAPDAGVAGPPARADDRYARGRALHLARRYDEAVAAYQAALQADPGHVNARNGLAIAYAERREFARAIPIWQEMTRGATLSSGPAVAFLFSNLGYAHLLAGDDEKAVAALEKACLLDPLNGRAWQNLGEALQRLGQDERARQMLRQASALREHDLRADYAMVPGERPATIARALDGARRPDQEWAFVEIADKGNGMLELRRTPALHPRGAPAAAPFQPPTAGGAGAVAGLEISNGNGRQGLARLLASRIRDPEVKIVRLSNEKGFAVRQTRIEYRPAFRGVAERLAQRFGASQPVAVGAGRADVRLVLGHDLAPQRVAGRSLPAPAGQPGLAHMAGSP